MKNRMSKDTIPDNFTLSLAAVDAIPVLAFGMTMVLVSILLQSPLFLLGALLSLFAGAAKVLWKFIVVLKRKNIWWMFLQMRILMPIGFLFMIAGVFLHGPGVDGGVILAQMMVFPQMLFFMLGILGMILMMVFAKMLDSSDVRSNWIEQITNGIAQISTLIGVLLTLID